MINKTEELLRKLIITHGQFYYFYTRPNSNSSKENTSQEYSDYFGQLSTDDYTAFEDFLSATFWLCHISVEDRPEECRFLSDFAILNNKDGYTVFLFRNSSLTFSTCAYALALFLQRETFKPFTDYEFSIALFPFKNAGKVNENPVYIVDGELDSTSSIMNVENEAPDQEHPIAHYIPRPGCFFLVGLFIEAVDLLNKMGMLDESPNSERSFGIGLRCSEVEKE